MPLRRTELEISSGVGLLMEEQGGIKPPPGTGTTWDVLSVNWDGWVQPWGDGNIDPTTGAWWNTQNVNWDSWQLTWGM